MYSLTRVDAICDDGSILDDTLPLPPTPVPQSTKLSPSHSISSSSSGSYCTKNELKKNSSPTNNAITGPTKVVQDQSTKSKSGSVSDDDKSEKRYSSSGYYESPHDDGNANFFFVIWIIAFIKINYL